MKILASIGLLTLFALWAAFAIYFPQAIIVTAVTGFFVSMIFIWDMD